MSVPVSESPEAPHPAVPGESDAPLRTQLAVLGAIVLFAVVAGVLLAWNPVDPIWWLTALALYSGCAALLAWVRRSDRAAVLRTRIGESVEEFGGGFYGTGGLATFLYLEGLELHSRWAAAPGWGEFLRTLSLEWLIGFSVDSLLNGVQALIWPVHWMRELGPGPALAGAALLWLVHAAVARLWSPRTSEAA